MYKRPSSRQYCDVGYGASGLDFADALRFLGMVSCGVVDMVTPLAELFARYGSCRIDVD